MGLISKKNNFASARGTFSVHFFAAVLSHDYNVNLSSYTFYGCFAVYVPVRFLLHSDHFHPLGR